MQVLSIAGSGNEHTNSGGLNSNRSGGNSDVSRPMPVSLLYHHLGKIDKGLFAFGGVCYCHLTQSLIHQLGASSVAT